MEPAGLLTVLAVLCAPVVIIAAVGTAGRDRVRAGPASLALTASAVLVAAVAGGNQGAAASSGARLVAMLQGVVTLLLPAALAWLALLGLGRADRGTRAAGSALVGVAAAVLLVVYLRQFQ